MVRISNGRSTRPQPGGPRRVRRRDARRQEILRAAAGHFRARGFAATGMREIAEAADLSPGNLYYYFRSKDEILYYCQDRALDRLMDAVKRAKRASASPRRQLRHVLAAHGRIVLDDVEAAFVHVELPEVGGPRWTRIVKKRDRYERSVRSVIDAGIARGEFAVADSAIVVRAMLGAVNWTANWFDPAGATPAAGVADTIAEFLVRGVEA